MRRCQAYNRHLAQCQSRGRFDHYHQAFLCDRHADMEYPALTADQARDSRLARDNAWHNKQRKAP